MMTEADLGNRLFWHGSAYPRLALRAGRCSGVHIGTLPQAYSRRNEFLHAVTLTRRPKRVMRALDQGDRWPALIETARAEGVEIISYLNRWEGLDPLPRWMQVDYLNGPAYPPNPDYTDDLFLKDYPEAKRSLLVLNPELLSIRRIVPWEGYVTLHKALPQNQAEDAMKHGLPPGTEFWPDRHDAEAVAGSDAVTLRALVAVKDAFTPRVPVMPETIAGARGQVLLRAAVPGQSLQRLPSEISIQPQGDVAPSA